MVFKNKDSIFEETTINIDTSQGVTKILAKVSLLQKDMSHLKIGSFLFEASKKKAIELPFLSEGLGEAATIAEA